MTGLLKDVMTERADRLESPTIDLEAITRNGNQRVRRNRLAAVAATATLGAVVALGASSLPKLQQADPADDQVMRPPVASVSWSHGPVIHSGDHSVDVGREVYAYVKTDIGYVFSDPDGTVWSWVDGELEEVGTVVHSSKNIDHLKSDGTLAGWVESGAAGRPRFAILDQRTGAVIHDDTATEGMDIGSDGRDPAYLIAFDDGVAYWRDSRGLVAFDVAAQRARVLGGPSDARQLYDVESGKFVRTNDEDSGPTVVSTNIDANRPTYPVTRDDLSPGGRYLRDFADGDGVRIRVVDTQTGRSSTLVWRGTSYQSMIAQWIDADSFVVVVDRVADGSVLDLLTCDVRSQRCEVTDAAVGSENEVQLPLGGHWGTPAP